MEDLDILGQPNSAQFHRFAELSNCRRRTVDSGYCWTLEALPAQTVGRVKAGR